MNAQCPRCLSSSFPKTDDGCTFCSGRNPVKCRSGNIRFVHFNEPSKVHPLRRLKVPSTTSPNRLK